MAHESTGNNDDGVMNLLHSHKRKVEEDVRVVMDDLKAMKSDLEGAVPLKDRIREKPWPYVAGALGAGFIMGGGLTSKITRKLLKLAMLKMGLPLAKAVAMDAFMGIVESRTQSGVELPGEEVHAPMATGPQGQEG